MSAHATGGTPGALRAALAVEALKVRRSAVPRVAALAVVLVAPGISAGFLAAARADLDGPLAAKVAPMLVDTGWAGLTGLVGQVVSVGLLLAAGVVVAWSYGREFTDGTFGAMFAVPTPRRTVALAKALVLVGWGAVVGLVTVAVGVALGVAAGLGVPDAAAWPGAARALAVALLTVALALPLGAVASALRGYLPGIGALLGLVVATQVLAVVGVGAWFPYAAVGMWSGMGGAEVAAAVGPAQLLLALPVGAAGVLASVLWWDRAEVA